MIIKVGDQTFDSARVPVVLAFSETDLQQLVQIPRKYTNSTPTQLKYLFLKCPNDIPLAQVAEWVRQIGVELSIPK